MGSIQNKNTNGSRERWMNEREMMQELTPGDPDYGKVRVGTDGTEEGEILLAKNSDVAKNTAVNGTATLVRYDKVLGALDILNMEYDVNEDLVTVRYTGDNDSAVYYRDVLSYTGGNLTLVEHFYNTADLVTESGATTLVYDGSDNLLSATYVEV